MRVIWLRLLFRCMAQTLAATDECNTPNSGYNFGGEKIEVPFHKGAIPPVNSDRNFPICVLRLRFDYVLVEWFKVKPSQSNTSIEHLNSLEPYLCFRIKGLDLTNSRVFSVL